MTFLWSSVPFEKRHVPFKYIPLILTNPFNINCAEDSMEFISLNKAAKKEFHLVGSRFILCLATVVQLARLGKVAVIMGWTSHCPRRRSLYQRIAFSLKDYISRIVYPLRLSNSL